MVENITIKNKVTNQSLELDVVTTPNYILDVVDWGQVGSTHHQFKYVNQIGVYVTGTSLETRNITITGWIVARTVGEMTVRKQMLNRFINPQQIMEIKYSDYTIEFLPDTSVQYSATIAENNEVVCKFKITGFAPDPLFKDSNQSKISAATTTGKFHFPLVIGGKDKDGLPTVIFGLRTPSLIASVYNYGAVGTGMTFVFYAKGSLTNPYLLNVETQEFFKINKSMEAGEKITINTQIGEKKVIGSIDGVESNYFKYRDLDSTWLQLAVGDNLFRYNADDGINNLECYIYFYNRYLEVQECY